MTNQIARNDSSAVQIPVISVARSCLMNHKLPRFSAVLFVSHKLFCYTWMVWKVLGLDHRWQHYRQDFFFLSWYNCHKYPREIVSLFNQVVCLTLILLMWRIWWVPNNVRKWQTGFNSAFKGLIQLSKAGLLSISPKMDKTEYRAVIRFCYIHAKRRHFSEG